MTNLIQLKPIDQDAAKSWVEKAEGFNKYLKLPVDSQMSLDGAVGIIRTIDKFRKELEEKRMEITRPLDQAKKAVMDLFRPAVDRCDEIALDLRKKINTYQQAMEEKRIAEQRKLEEKARLEEAKKRKELLEKSELAKSRGDLEKAEMLAEKAEEVSIQAPIVAPKIQAAEGSYTVKKWSFKVVNADLIPREYMIPNEYLLNKVAGIYEGKKEIAGVEFFYETVTRVRK